MIDTTQLTRQSAATPQVVQPKVLRFGHANQGVL